MGGALGCLLPIPPSSLGLPSFGVVLLCGPHVAIICPYARGVKGKREREGIARKGAADCEGEGALLRPLSPSALGLPFFFSLCYVATRRCCAQLPEAWLK